LLKFNKKTQFKASFFALSLLFSSTNALAEWLQVQVTSSFGTVIPGIGNCTFNPITLVMSSPSDLCTGGETLGHIKIFGPANQMQKVKLLSVDDVGNGIHFAPMGRLVNNLGDDISAPIAGSETWIRIGSDGVLDIYVGGTLTLSQTRNGSSVFTVKYDVEYTRP